MMATQKLYAGVKLREIRGRLSLTQKAFADKLTVSPALSQPDGKQPPPRLGGGGACLAQEFGLDVTELTVGESERLVTDMREALADPVFSARNPARRRPAPCRLERACPGPRLPDLHRAYRQTHERLASPGRGAGARRRRRCAPRPGRRFATSFTIATIIWMPSTAQLSISPPPQPAERLSSFWHRIC
jgi:XRE family transcriptional regulator, fatty acid utilization regulator